MKSHSLPERKATASSSTFRPSSRRVFSSRTTVTHFDASQLTSYALPPWPEWSDAEVNAERWYTRGKQYSQRPRDDAPHTTPSSFATVAQFEDPMGHAPLPCSLQPHSWRRLYTIPHMTVCHEDVTDSPVIDLATCNTHLLHSEVMRWILAGIMNLYQLGRAHHMELEGEDQDFCVHAHPWKPWHHVYSLNKVSKNRYHNPVTNPDGKYIVRLFYMGCWRRITVDDYLPLDNMRRPLLPMTVSGDEMWPALLTKALLKVASLSWTEDKEIQDFSVMACLTGWHAQELDLYGVPSRTIWWLCQKLLMSDNNSMEDRFSVMKERTVSDLYETSSSTHGPSLYPSLEPAFTDSCGEVPGSVFLCAVVHTLPAGLSPCVEHPVLITGTKIDPQGEIRPPTPLWKTFRWKKWALEQGIITETPEKIVKSIRMFSSLQNCLPNMNPVASIPSMVDLPQPLRKHVKHPHKSTIVHHDSVALLKSQISRSKKHAKYEDKNEDTVFPEMWIKFEKLVHCIKRFEIYYSTKSFQHNLNVTDISEIHQEKKTTRNKKHHSKETKRSLASIMNTENTIKSKADILYLLMDSVTCKKLIISLSVLKPDVELPREFHQPRSSSALGEADGNGNNSLPPPVMYYILGESYDWQSSEIQDIKFAIKTVGTKCHLLQFQEGLTVVRLWIKLPEVYAIRISSQMPFILGNREVIEDTLASESVSWKQYGTKFSSAFNALSNMKLDSPDHEELLENLHKSYLPPFIPKASSHFATRLKRKIHSKFEDALVSLLLEKTNDIDTIAKIILEWKWLFGRNDFGSGIQTKIGDDVEIQNTRINEVKEGSEMKMARSVKEITSVYGIEHHDIDDKHLTPVTSTRKKLISFDEESGIEFLRRMLGNDPELIKYYPFRNDDKNRIFFTDYTGFVPNVTEEWIPLVRFVVNIHSDTFHHCALHLSTTLPYAVIELINNDTLERFPRYLGGIEPSYIRTNCDGYTVFAYGKAEGQNSHDHSWKVRFVSAAREESHLPHSCSWITTKECLPQEPPQLTIKEIKGNYMPNTDDIIFKCALTLQKTQNLTMRAVMSKNNVEFALRITEEDGEVIREYHAFGEIVIPVVQLRGRDFNVLDFYVIEAQVLGKTWILTAEELELVNTLRDQAFQEQLKYREEKLKKKKSPLSPTSSGRKRPKAASSTLVSEFNSDAPHWKLMIVVDQELSSTVTIEKDQRRLEQIQGMKVEWELAERGRSKKSSQIRQSFLHQDLYSSYLHNYIHEQGIAPGEKTRYLLQHLSFKKSEYQPDTYELYCPSDRQETSKHQTEEFDFEYDGIRKKFNEIKRKQSRDHRMIRNHLSETTDESKAMINQAYMERDTLVERITEQLRLQQFKDRRRTTERKSVRQSRKSIGGKRH